MVTGCATPGKRASTEDLKLSDLAKQICWQGEGRGRINGPDGKIPFTFEAYLEKAKKLWKVDMTVPLRGTYFAQLNYQRSPDGPVTWKLEGQEKFPKRKWKEIFNYVGKLLYLANQSPQAAKTDSSFKEKISLTPAGVLVKSENEAGTVLILELRQFDSNYFKVLRVLYGDKQNQGRDDTAPNDAGLILQFNQCQEL